MVLGENGRDFDGLAVICSRDYPSSMRPHGTVVSTRFSSMAGYVHQHPSLAEEFWDRFNLITADEKDLGYLYDCEFPSLNGLDTFPGEKEEGLGVWPDMRVPYTHIGRVAKEHLEGESGGREHYANMTDDEIGDVLLLLNHLDVKSRERAREGANYIVDRLFTGTDFVSDLHGYVESVCDGAPESFTFPYFREVASAALGYEEAREAWRDVRRVVN